LTPTRDISSRLRGQLTVDRSSNRARIRLQLSRFPSHTHPPDGSLFLRHPSALAGLPLRLLRNSPPFLRQPHVGSILPLPSFHSNPILHAISACLGQTDSRSAISFIILGRAGVALPTPPIPLAISYRPQTERDNRCQSKPLQEYLIAVRTAMCGAEFCS
jgi:hypothetical protein